MLYEAALASRNSGRCRTMAFRACNGFGAYRGAFENFYVLDLALVLLIFFGPQTLLKPVECRPCTGWLRFFVTIVLIAVQILSTRRANTLAIRAAKVYHRDCQNKRIAYIRQNIYFRSRKRIIDMHVGVAFVWLELRRYNMKQKRSRNALLKRIGTPGAFKVAECRNNGIEVEAVSVAL